MFVVIGFEKRQQIEPVQYSNLLLYLRFHRVVLKSNPTTPHKMGILYF
jgi:hypothetical protein